MVLGIGALASLGLALPTGMAFGYGYGYGVRAGYSAFKEPSSEVQKLKLSANPVTGALGAGLQSAEERTNVPILGTIPKNETPEPSITAQSQKLTTDKPEYVWNRDQTLHWPKTRIYEIGRKHGFSERESFKKYINGEYPFRPRKVTSKMASRDKYQRYTTLR